MQIDCQLLGKRFNKEWIFRNVTTKFCSGNAYAIVGKNGSGKSTLLQTIAGAILPSEGTIIFTNNEQIIDAHNAYAAISLVAPYVEIIEEMTATEFLNFHFSFKKSSLPIPAILGIIGLEQAAHKQIRYYSSGMKQRIKLAQAFFATTQILLLDEPCTNLDDAGIELYNHLIKTYTTNKIVIVCSNDKEEYSFCQQEMLMQHYK